MIRLSCSPLLLLAVTLVRHYSCSPCAQGGARLFPITGAARLPTLLSRAPLLSCVDTMAHEISRYFPTAFLSRISALMWPATFCFLQSSGRGQACQKARSDPIDSV